MRFAILLSASLAITACGTSAPPQQPTTPRRASVECVGGPDCRIGANGSKLTGRAVEVAGPVQTVTLPSGETVSPQ